MKQMGIPEWLAADRVGREQLAQAFAQSTFVYGTGGTGSTIVKGLKRWASRPRTRAAAQVHGGVSAALAARDQALVPVIARELNLFDPGRRASTYLALELQMMDMYYGQAGNTLYTKRIPIIAEYIHYAMGFTGAFSMDESGRDAYQRTFATQAEGWKGDSPKHPAWAGNTATKEISRFVRLGIYTFGGTLIFEGKEVYYSQVFKQKSYISDTDAEARELFAFFRPGQSEAQYGKGRIKFYWCGKETVPTKLHFLTNWTWEQDSVTKKSLTHAIQNMAHAGGRSFDAGELTATWNNFNDVPLAMVGKEEEYLSVIERMHP